MVNDNVADFMKRLKAKQKKERLKEIVSASGWELNGEFFDESDLCIYLIDSIERAIVLFGCKKELLVEKSIDDYSHWGHFVAAWDVIADPDMPFDEEHKTQTIKLALEALQGVALWRVIVNKVQAGMGNKRPHILVIIDRTNTLEPLDIILARSESLLMNTESIQSIIDNYKDNV